MAPTGSEGYKRQWRWYTDPATGGAVAKDELLKLPAHGQAALLAVILDHEKGRQVDRKPLGHGLHELRTNVGGQQFRVIFFADTDPFHDICLLAFEKVTQKTPTRRIQLARQRMSKWKAEGARRRAT